MRPEIRTAISKELLAVVRAWDDERTERILVATGEETVAMIDEAHPIGWTDFAAHMHFSDCIRAEVGTNGNIAAWSEVFANVSQRPLLRGFFAAMSRLSPSPATVFKGSPRVFNLTNRNVGTFRYRPDEANRSAEITLTGFPATDFTIDCYAEGLLGSIRSVMRSADDSGLVDLVEVDPARGLIRYALSW